MSPEIILAFDASAAHCAAALLWGEVLADARHITRVTTRVELMQKGQAEAMVPMLDALLADASLGWDDISAVAVGVGPGNFTGIRIAVALARGLALGLQVPAIGVTGFEAMAPAAKHPFWAVIDAPRDQTYVQRQCAETHAPRSVARADLDTLDAPLLWMSQISVDDLIRNIAVTGFHRAASPHPRPAPFYLRGADAAPPSELPPVILP